MTHPITTYLNNVREKLNSGLTTEHSHRPALAALFESLERDIISINEPIRIECGAPDLAILKNDFLVGHVEAKDVGRSLDEIESSDQLKRYRQALDNLILTDYLEFRWYVDGECRRKIHLAKQDLRGDLQIETHGRQNLEDLLSDFLDHQPQSINTPRNLAERMARITHLIRDVIMTAFEKDSASDILTGWRQAFAEVLIPDLDQPENLGQFADMFAQTLSYGLFSARIMHQTGIFNRHTAQEYLPRTNPFLRDFFSYITGPQLSDEPYAGYVNDLIQILALADMHHILADFGHRTGHDDPMMHFYETFLAAYDPQLREKRGVYYTPMPVVSFIVRSVDHILKTRFNLPQGLADTTKLPDGNHKVLVLDPAVGTATFLYAVIDLIREDFMKRNDAGMWSDYVRNYLLDRIFGFEIMIAPYAVAHFKLALQLAGHDLDLPEDERKRWAYDFNADDRIRVYLTNTLEVLPEDMRGLYGPMQFVTEEAKAADKVKQEIPIMVVLGNPPYSVSSSNKGEFIDRLMNRYKEAVSNERNIQPLSDDYIKFIRFAHDRVERTGSGIIAMITNHSYLSGLVHRGMREKLMSEFNEIFIINLHGNALINEINPNDGKDENVFDIRQGVSISVFIKSNNLDSKCKIKYFDLWGSRNSKSEFLMDNSINNIEWVNLDPSAPYFFFVRKDFSYSFEYENCFSIEDIFIEYATGTGTGRDSAFVSFHKNDIEQLSKDITSPQKTNEDITLKYGLKNTSGWNFFGRRNNLININILDDIRNYHYRPFDIRFVLYNPIIRRDSKNIMYHMSSNNIGLLLCQQQAKIGFNHVFCTRHVVDESVLSTTTRERGYLFPLYLYPEDNSFMLFDSSINSFWDPDINHGNRVPNLYPEIINIIEEKLGISFNPHLTGNKYSIDNFFGPDDILSYIYGIFHSLTFRYRYAEFLKIDFPRVPFTSNLDLFRNLVYLGRKLISLHLLESPKFNNFITNFPIPGDSQVANRGGFPKYTQPDKEHIGRVYINHEQYFEGVPKNVWEFEIGGYQVLYKWLKDRRGCLLDYDDKCHYQKIIVALSETIRLMDEIDAAIPSWPLQ